MKNFLRILRMSLRFRWTIAGSCVCSLMVAVLWGANIGTLYPVVKIVLYGESPSESLARQIQEGEKAVLQLREQIAAHGSAETVDDLSDGTAPQQRLATYRTRLEAEEKAVEFYRSWKPWVDRYLPQRPLSTMGFIIAILMVGTILKGVFLAAHEILVSRLSNLTLFDLRKQLYRHTLKMDLTVIENDRTSGLMSRFTNDVMRIGNGISTAFGPTIREPLKVVACLVGAACVSWRLLAISLLIAPFTLLTLRWMAQSIRRNSDHSAAAMSGLYKRLSESFGGIRVVRVFTMERAQRRRFHLTSKHIYRRVQKLARLRAGIKPMTEIVGVAVVSVSLLLGAHLVISHETSILGIQISPRPLSPAALLVFYAFLSGAVDPLRKLSGTSITINRSAAAADRLYKLLEREPQVSDPQPSARRCVPRGPLVFEGVGFNYPKGPPVLSGIDLRIEPGECLAIVGPNGCGKSTLISLIPRLFDPSSGRICIGNVNLRELRLRDLRRQIGMVTQATRLFDDTILNNIRDGAPGVSEAEVMAAAERAGAYQFITQSLPYGFATVVGENATFLSGGQAQRIALARAIVRNPAILILDEATSSFDMDAEKAVLDQLATFLQGRTTIIVTHRPEALRLADRIVVMDCGEIRHVMTYSEFMAQDRDDEIKPLRTWKKSA